jgi:hypothetical protein
MNFCFAVKTGSGAAARRRDGLLVSLHRCANRMSVRW